MSASASPRYAELLARLDVAAGTLGVEMGLDRVRRALARLGDPQRRYLSVQIAGTNGKGSTAAIAEAILRRAGLRAALARSPGPIATRIQAFSERAFRIDHADGGQGMALHDPLAVGVAFDPSLVKWEAMRLAIGPDGETVRVSGAPNCRVAKGVDRDRFLRLFLDRLCPPTSRRPASS